MLYPPPFATFDAECFNLDAIRRLALNADDVWLKFMELRCGIKCVYVPCKRWGIGIRSKALRGTGLCIENCEHSGNDVQIENCQKAYGISLADYAVVDEDSL